MPNNIPGGYSDIESVGVGDMAITSDHVVHQMARAWPCDGLTMCYLWVFWSGHPSRLTRPLSRCAAAPVAVTRVWRSSNGPTCLECIAQDPDM